MDSSRRVTPGLQSSHPPMEATQVWKVSMCHQGLRRRDTERVMLLWRSNPLPRALKMGPCFVLFRLITNPLEYGVCPATQPAPVPWPVCSQRHSLRIYYVAIHGALMRPTRSIPFMSSFLADSVIRGFARGAQCSTAACPNIVEPDRLGRLKQQRLHYACNGSCYPISEAYPL